MNVLKVLGIRLTGRGLFLLFFFVVAGPSCGGEQVPNSPVCGDGAIEGEEECDEGPANSDEVPNACRANCVPAHCGDGVIDEAEACDAGDANSDTVPDACRLSCRVAKCGDGATDSNEQCDEGPANSDEVPNACRANCVLAHCGDGVIDEAEACDAGDANSDTVPDACRTNCSAATCGDGTLDTGEQCDEGSANADGVPDGCSTTCALPHCASTEVSSSSHATAGTITGQRGDSISVTCDIGYIGGGEWICGASGAFAGTLCSPIPCVSTSAPNSDHASPGRISGVFGEVVNVVCDSGYEGGGEWVCKDDGTFSAGVPCVAAPCDGTVPPENGARGDCADQIPSGTTCQPTCGEGYFITGVSSCLAGVLTPATCTSTPAGFFSPVGVNEPTAVTTCAAGNGVDVPPTPSTDTVCISCVVGTNWSDTDDSTGVCEPVGTCPEGEGMATQATAESDTQCAPCVGGVTWNKKDDATTRCAPVTTCPEGEGVATDSTASTDTVCTPCVVGTNWNNIDDSTSACENVTECEEGKTLSGATATNDGTCDTNACAPKTVPNSSYKTNALTGTHGTEITVTCDAGYGGADGGGTWTCGEDGQFSGKACEPGSCSEKTFLNSIATLTGVTGDTAVVTCNAGTQGGGRWECTSSGSWSGTGCTKCPEGTASSGGATCEPCEDGITFASDTANTTCSPVSKCGLGKGLTSPPTTTTDTVCVDCDGTTTYSDVNDQTACKPFRVCPNGKTLSGATSTNDGTCDANACASITIPNSNREVNALTAVTDEQVTATCNSGYTASSLFDERANFRVEETSGVRMAHNVSASSADASYKCSYTTCGIKALSFGPYLPVAGTGDYECRFELKTDGKNVGDKSDDIVRVDVRCAGCGGVLATTTLTREDFNQNNAYQTFVVPFTKANANGKVECRVFLKDMLADDEVWHRSTQVVDETTGKTVTLTCGADGFSGNRCGAVKCGVKPFDNASQVLDGVVGDGPYDVTCNNGYQGGSGWSCGTSGNFGGTGCSRCTGNSFSTGGATCQPCPSGQITNGAKTECEAPPCPDVEGGSCTACSDAWTCTAVECDDNLSDRDQNANNGCEHSLPVQDNHCVPDVVSQFNALKHHGEILGFGMGVGAEIKISTQKHWQGITRYNGPQDGDTTPYFFVTRSGKGMDKGDPGVLVTVSMASRNKDGLRMRSNRLGGDRTDKRAPDPWDKITSLVEYSDFTHPGGLQMLGDLLVVPLDQPSGSSGLHSDRGRIMVYDARDPENLLVVEQIELQHEAGDVAMIRLGPNEDHLLVVGGYKGSGLEHSGKLDFFRSNGVPIGDVDSQFTSLDEWDYKTDSLPDQQKWATDFFGAAGYQSLTLLRQCYDNNIFLLAGHNTQSTGMGSDQIELFSISINEQTVSLKKEATKHLYCNWAKSGKPCNFSGASGAYVDPSGNLIVYATDPTKGGPSDTVEMAEFRHQNVTWQGTCNAPWIELFEKQNMEGRSVMYDYADRNSGNWDNLDDLDDFAGEASSLRMCTPVGSVFYLYSNANYKGDLFPVDSVRGTGIVQEIDNLGSFECSSSNCNWSNRISSLRLLGDS